MRRSEPTAPTDTTLASPPSVEPAPSATEFSPVLDAFVPSAVASAADARAPPPAASESVPMAELSARAEFAWKYFAPPPPLTAPSRAPSAPPTSA